VRYLRKDKNYAVRWAPADLQHMVVTKAGVKPAWKRMGAREGLAAVAM
jgi:hypothetical protein